MKFIVVSNVRRGNAMLKIFEGPRLDGYCSVVGKHVTVWANAKQIVTTIVAIMRSSEWSDMMCLAIVSAANHELRAAQLTHVVVEKFSSLLMAVSRMMREMR